MQTYQNLEGGNVGNLGDIEKAVENSDEGDRWTRRLEAWTSVARAARRSAQRPRHAVSGRPGPITTNSTFFLYWPGGA